MAAAPPTTMKNPNVRAGKFSIFSHLKYEHMIAGISGGVTSTLLLHPLDLIKIRFAGELKNLLCFWLYIDPEPVTAWRTFI